MTALLVLGGLLALLAFACWWESRSGRPAWGAHLDHREAPTTAHASRAGKTSVGATLATGALFGVDGGGDGG